MGEGAVDERNLDEVLLSGLSSLRDGCGYLARLAETHTDDTFTVANDNNRGEAESTTTLSNLGDAVDVNETIRKLEIVCVPYSVIIFCHRSLEFETGLASGVGQRFDTSVIEVAVAVENNSVDTGSDSGLSDELTYLRGLSCLIALEVLDVLRALSYKRPTLEIIDELDVNLLVAAENSHARALCSSADLAADARLDLIASCYFRESHCRIN